MRFHFETIANRNNTYRPAGELSYNWVADTFHTCSKIDDIFIAVFTSSGSMVGTGTEIWVPGMKVKGQNEI